MHLIDTHTHLFSGEFDADRADMIKRAIAAGVVKMYLPNIDASSVDAMLKLETEFPQNCFAMMGLHPGSVKENYLEELKKVEDWLGKRKFSAIGEIGMDYYWDRTFVPQQKNAFSLQVDWAKKFNLPIVIHQRECFDDTFELVKSRNGDYLRGIFHCFTGTPDQAKKIISLGGFKLGIGGVVTYKKSNLHETLKQIDLKHIVLETDSPYLAPVPYRGKRNESSYLPIIANKVAEIKGVSVNEVAEITTKNAQEIFG